MANRSIPTCGEDAQVLREWKPVTFEYSDGGVSVRVPNVYAWVCPIDGEVSFVPETVDELIETVRELVATARHAQQRRSAFTEYVVSIGIPEPTGYQG